MWDESSRKLHELCAPIAFIVYGYWVHGIIALEIIRWTISFDFKLGRRMERKESGEFSCQCKKSLCVYIYKIRQMKNAK